MVGAALECKLQQQSKTTNAVAPSNRKCSDATPGEVVLANEYTRRGMPGVYFLMLAYLLFLCFLRVFPSVDASASAVRFALVSFFLLFT